MRTHAVRSDVQSIVSLQEFDAGPPPSASSGSLTTIFPVPLSLGTRRLVTASPRCSHRGWSLAGKRRAQARRSGRLTLPVFHASSERVGCGSPERTRAVRSSGPVGFARHHSAAVFNRFMLRLAHEDGRCPHRHKLLRNAVTLDYIADRPGFGGFSFTASAMESSVNRRVPGGRR